MSVKELEQLRNETKKYIDAADEHLLKTIYDMLKADAQDDSDAGYDLPELTREQNELLNKRIAMEDQGHISFSSWEEAKARILAGR